MKSTWETPIKRLEMLVVVVVVLRTSSVKTDGLPIVWHVLFIVEMAFFHNDNNNNSIFFLLYSPH